MRIKILEVTVICTRILILIFDVDIDIDILEME